MTREEALTELQKSPYPSEGLLRSDMNTMADRLGISALELEEIVNARPRRHEDFRSQRAVSYQGCHGTCLWDSAEEKRLSGVIRERRVPSSYLALIACEMGLRPLFIHVDTGWNSEVSVENVSRLV